MQSKMWYLTGLLYAINVIRKLIIIKGGVRVRDNRFRAWSKENNGFVYCELTTGRVSYRISPITEGTVLNPVLEEWQQYTGLLDKQGKEIYEGDIIQPQTQSSSTAEVQFEAGNFIARFSGHGTIWNLGTRVSIGDLVIGNIYGTYRRQNERD